MKKRTSIVLALLLTVLLFTGCTSSKDVPAANSANASTAKPVDILPEGKGSRVKSELVSMPVDDVTLADAVACPEGVFMYGYDLQKTACFFRLDRETMQIEALPEVTAEGVSGISASNSGALCVLSVDEDGQYRIYSYKPDGSRHDVTLNEDLYRDDYIRSFVATDNGYFLITGRHTFALDLEGNLIKDYGEYTGAKDVIKLSDEKCLLVTYGGFQEDGSIQASQLTKIREIDGDFNLGDSYEIPIKFTPYYPGLEGSLLARLENTLYSYSYTDGKCTALINAFTSGMDTAGLVQLNTDSYFSISKGRPAMWTPVEDDDVQILTLATYECSWLLENSISEFNAANPNYKIEIKDYAAFDNYGVDNGLQLLATDIISGKVPDIYDLSCFNPRQFAQRGLLLDLKTMFEADDEIDYADLLPSVAAALEYKGGLYELVPAFSLVTMCSDISITGTEWSVEDFIRLCNEYGTRAILGRDMTKADFLGYVLCFMKDELYSEEELSCSFDSRNFIDLLNIAAQLADSFDYDGSQGTPLMRAYTGEQKVCLDSFGSVIVSEISWYDSIFGGEAQFVGFPTDSGSGFGLAPSVRLGISSSSQYQYSAWEFFKYLLDNPRLFSELPLRESKLDENLDVWIEHAEKYEPGVVSTLGDETINIDGCAPKENIKEQILDMVDKIDCVAVCDKEVLDIVMDCSGSFFAGGKTAEETAAVIQSRVKIYLSEQYG